METIAIFFLIVVAGFCFFKMRTSATTNSRHAPSNGEHAQPGALHGDDWVQPFVLYYVANEMRLVPDGAVPESVSALATGQLPVHVQQSMLVALQSYLTLEYARDRRPEDWPKSVRGGYDFLQAELRTLSSPVAVSQYVRRMHESDKQSVVTEESLKAEVTSIIADVKNNAEHGILLLNSMLKQSTERLFAERHGSTIRAYAKRMAIHSERL